MTVIRSEASAMLWIAQAQEDAADYAAEYEAVQAEKLAAKSARTAKRVTPYQQLAFAL